MEHNSEVFLSQLVLIDNGVIKNLVIKTLEEKVHDRFFVAPSSTSGKYHPEYSLGKKGLVRHTKACVYLAVEILNLEFMTFEFTEEETDLIIGAIILHDTCKSGYHWTKDYTDFKHPLYVRELWDKNELSEIEWFYWNKMMSLVESHMGEWNTNKYEKGSLPKPQTKAQKLVHLVDYLSSRKEIDIQIFDESDF